MTDTTGQLHLKFSVRQPVDRNLLSILLKKLTITEDADTLQSIIESVEQYPNFVDDLTIHFVDPLSPVMQKLTESILSLLFKARNMALLMHKFCKGSLQKQRAH